MKRYEAALAGLELGQQVQDRRLDGDVEGRGRLVADDEVGPARERARDGDALALAAADLGGEGVQVALAQPHRLQQAARAGAPGPPVGEAEQLERARHRVEDRPPRVQREVRVLEHDLEPPAERPGPGEEPPGQGRPLQPDPAPGGTQQADHAARDRGLARAALAHDRQGLADRDIERDAVERPHDAPPPPGGSRRRAVLVDEVLRRQERPLGAGAGHACRPRLPAALARRGHPVREEAARAVAGLRLDPGRRLLAAAVRHEPAARGELAAVELAGGVGQRALDGGQGPAGRRGVRPAAGSRAGPPCTDGAVARRPAGPAPARRPPPRTSRRPRRRAGGSRRGCG